MRFPDSPLPNPGAARTGLAGKVVVVTGAGSGIGRAVATALGAAGACLGLLGRREAPLQEVAAEVCAGRDGEEPRCLALPADVGDPDAVLRAVDAVLRRFGRLDGVVNNAGLARFSPIDRADLSEFEAMLDANLRGPVHVIRAGLPALREHRGAIVNVSSVGGVLAMPGRSLYGATKAALNSLTRSLARELAPDVRVNAVLPGPVDTPMYDDLGLCPDEVARLRSNLVAGTPMGRFAAPEEIAPWVCTLLDGEVSGWVTGALVAIDGGRTA